MSEAVARPIEPAPGRAPGPSPSPSPSPAADAPGGAVVLRLTEAAWGLVLLGLLGWLGWAAAVSRVDNYDSYDVICNARHLLGRTPEMIAHRPPLLAAMMIPSELARERWGLHPLDVRPYHAAMALIHAGYLLVGIVPAFLLLQSVLVVQRSFDYSLLNTTRNALLLPMGREAKYQAKTAIDTFFYRTGDLLATGSIFVGLRLFDDARAQLVWLVAAISLALLLVAWLVGREYARRERAAAELSGGSLGGAVLAQ